MTDVHDEHWALKEATASAAESPCAKSKRGVVLWDPYHPSKVFCRGVNAPAFGQCTEDEACRARCNKLCIHAEADAILGCESFDLWRCHLLHVKVVDGVAVPSGPPSCASCSALIVRAGIESVWLLHEDGLRKYDAAEFHRLSVAHNPLAGLYVIRNRGSRAPASASAELWWRSDSNGYTSELMAAGVYDEAKARRLESRRPEEDNAVLLTEALRGLEKGTVGDYLGATKYAVPGTRRWEDA